MSESPLSFSLFHPKGVKCFFNVGGITAPGEQLEVVGRYLDAGWLVLQPGLEEGEHKDQFVHVVRGMINDTHTVDLYREEDQFRFLGIYLDSDEDIAAFNFASGLDYHKLPEYVGVGHIERNKSKQTDRFVVRAAKPFGAVWKNNPKHNPDTEEGKKKQKRLFVRWVDQKPAGDEKTPQTQEPAPQQAPKDAPKEAKPMSQDVQDLIQWLTLDPSLYEINAWLPKLKTDFSPDDALKMWNTLKRHCEGRGMYFDETNKVFVNRF